MALLILFRVLLLKIDVIITAVSSQFLTATVFVAAVIDVVLLTDDAAAYVIATAVVVSVVNVVLVDDIAVDEVIATADGS